MSLTVNKVLRVLSYEHGEVRPGAGGRSTTYDGVYHVVLTIRQTHFKETESSHFELSYIAI